MVLAGCGTPVCSLDNAVAQLGPPAADCGRLSSDSHNPVDGAAYRAAHDCLVAGFASHMSVTARWYAAGIDSADEGVWVGVPDGGGYPVYEIIGLGMLIDEASTTQRCGAVVDLGACAAITTGLCFTCENPTTTATCGS